MSNEMDIKELAERFDMSPAFIRKLKTMYMRMAANKGLGGLPIKEYQEYITFCQRFTTNIISKLKDDSQ